MKQKGKQLTTWGVILHVGWVVGLVGTVIGMVRAFGKGRPLFLISHIGLALFVDEMDVWELN